MAPSIYVRDVPNDVKRWIEEESFQKKMSQKEFVVKLLEEASGNGQVSLFDYNPLTAIKLEAGLPFTFIDLFAGIGGFRIGLERVGGRCLFSCEWDKYCQRTYLEWFGEVPEGDIKEINPKDIPDHDILAAGFPCQPFSIAGVTKKNALGRDHGFRDATQGTLFFDILRIAEVKRPPILFLENVKNLLSHDKGRTWEIIVSSLDELGYLVNFKVIDAKHFVPQHRERVFIVCFDRKVFGNHVPFQFPSFPEETDQKLKDILEKRVDAKYTLTDHLWAYLQDYAERHRRKGNGFGFSLCDVNGISRTMSARYYKDGAEVLIPQRNGKNPRRLTPREAARLLGFDDSLPIVVSDTQAYRQFGNAVVPLVVEDIGKQITKVLSWFILNKGNGCLIKK